MRSTRDKLLMSLSELQQFVMILIQSAQAQTTTNPVMPGTTTNQITAQIIEKQNLINQIIKEAEEQEEIQKQIEAEKQEYQRLESEVNKLQQQLRQSQQVLEMVVASATEKTERSAEVKGRQCSVKDLLSYSHLISSSFSSQMPANWTEMDHRRPWPTDLDMRVGELGRLAVQCGALPKLDDGVIAERESQQQQWKQQQPVKERVDETTRPELLPVKQDMSSSSDEDGYSAMEDVT